MELGSDGALNEHVVGQGWPDEPGHSQTMQEQPLPM